MRLARVGLLAMLGVVLLAGCARVVVLGHVVREGTPPETQKSEAPGDDAPANTGQAGVAPTASSNPRKVAASESQVSTPVLKSITLRVAPGATADVASDTPFDAGLLLEAIRAELRARKLLDEHNPQITGTAEVQIDRVVVRPSTNAVVFGHKMMASTLIGDVHFGAVEGSPVDGGTPPALHVSAESRLTLSAQNETKNPLAPLYRRFAELMADRLAGVESKPNDSTDGPQRF